MTVHRHRREGSERGEGRKENSGLGRIRRGKNRKMIGISKIAEKKKQTEGKGKNRSLIRTDKE